MHEGAGVMSMVCPRCQRSFEQQVHCRDCGCRLQYQANNLEATPVPAPTFPSDVDGQWQHTPWGKMLVGLLLAVGLNFGLQQLCTAGLLAGGEASGFGLWGTLWGLVLLHGLQGLSLIVGGAVTGAGQARGPLYGSLVGLATGGVFLALQRHHGDGQPDAILFAQPVLHVIVGAFGGLLGKFIWKPAPTIVLATAVQGSARPTGSATSPTFASPLHLGRVFTGVFIVVAGVVWSNVILEYVLRASNGNLAISSHLQARLIGWEIAALTTLLGAGLAGATTLNGTKQGLGVGIGAAVVIIGVDIGSTKLVLESLILMLASVFILSLAGGWFGGQLFPPIVAHRRRSLSNL
jgi:hypothetical protein